MCLKEAYGVSGVSVVVREVFYTLYIVELNI